MNDDDSADINKRKRKAEPIESIPDDDDDDIEIIARQSDSTRVTGAKLIKIEDDYDETGISAEPGARMRFLQSAKSVFRKLKNTVVSIPVARIIRAEMSDKMVDGNDDDEENGQYVVTLLRIPFSTVGMIYNVPVKVYDIIKTSTFETMPSQSFPVLGTNPGILINGEKIYLLPLKRRGGEHHQIAFSDFSRVSARNWLVSYKMPPEKGRISHLQMNVESKRPQRLVQSDRTDMNGFSLYWPELDIIHKKNNPLLVDLKVKIHITQYPSVDNLEQRSVVTSDKKRVLFDDKSFSISTVLRNLPRSVNRYVRSVHMRNGIYFAFLVFYQDNIITHSSTRAPYILVLASSPTDTKPRIARLNVSLFPSGFMSMVDMTIRDFEFTDSTISVLITSTNRSYDIETMGVITWSTFGDDCDTSVKWEGCIYFDDVISPHRAGSIGDGDLDYVNGLLIINPPFNLRDMNQIFNGTLLIDIKNMLRNLLTPEHASRVTWWEDSHQVFDPYYKKGDPLRFNDNYRKIGDLSSIYAVDSSGTRSLNTQRLMRDMNSVYLGLSLPHFGMSFPSHVSTVNARELYYMATGNRFIFMLYEQKNVAKMRLYNGQYQMYAIHPFLYVTREQDGFDEQRGFSSKIRRWTGLLYAPIKIQNKQEVGEMLNGNYPRTSMLKFIDKEKFPYLETLSNADVGAYIQDDDIDDSTLFSYNYHLHYDRESRMVFLPCNKSFGFSNYYTMGGIFEPDGYTCMALPIPAIEEGASSIPMKRTHRAVQSSAYIFKSITKVEPRESFIQILSFDDLKDKIDGDNNNAQFDPSPLPTTTENPHRDIVAIIPTSNLDYTITDFLTDETFSHPVFSL